MLLCRLTDPVYFIHQRRKEAKRSPGPFVFHLLFSTPNKLSLSLQPLHCTSTLIPRRHVSLCVCSVRVGICRFHAWRRSAETNTSQRLRRNHLIIYSLCEFAYPLLLCVELTAREKSQKKFAEFSKYL